MPLNAQADINTKIQEDLNSLKLKMPNGEMPHKEGLADLKGILPNPQTMKNILACGTGVPSEFLAGFDPTAALLATVPLPKVNVEIKDPLIDVTEIEKGIEIELPEINTEGLTEKEIEELERKREAQIKLNEAKTEAINKKLKENAEKINKLAGEVENQLGGGPSSILGAGLSGATGAPGVQDMILKIEAYKFFKAQIAAAEEKIKVIQEEVDKDVEEAKELLKKESEALEEDKNLQIELEEKKNLVLGLEGQADQMIPTFPSHPGPGNKADSKTTRKTLESRLNSDGFEETLNQATINTEKFLDDNFEDTKDILKVLLEIVAALIMMIALVSLLKSLLEMLMMLLFFKCNPMSGFGGGLNLNQSPEDYLCELGFPGFCDTDFTVPEIERPITPSSFSDSDLYDPQLIGTPLSQGDLLNNDYNNHPLLGDLTDIHPQLTNELYNEGILPPSNMQLDPDLFASDLDKLYDEILDELVSTNNIEYIEHLYNLNFEKIGYKRYLAPEKPL